jgi:hypothetical protein
MIATASKIKVKHAYVDIHKHCATDLRQVLFHLRTLPQGVVAGRANALDRARRMGTRRLPLNRNKIAPRHLMPRPADCQWTQVKALCEVYASASMPRPADCQWTQVKALCEVYASDAEARFTLMHGTKTQ